MLYDRDLSKLKTALVMFTFKCTESHSLNVNFVIVLLKMNCSETSCDGMYNDLNLPSVVFLSFLHFKHYKMC